MERKSSVGAPDRRSWPDPRRLGGWGGAIEPIVELIYFGSCPSVGVARQALEDALSSMGLSPDWQEWDLEDQTTPARLRGYGSPTVLIGGHDVRGGSPASEGLACRADGAPSADEIRRVLMEAWIV